MFLLLMPSDGLLAIHSPVSFNIISIAGIRFVARSRKPPASFATVKGLVIGYRGLRKLSQMNASERK